MAPIVIAHLAPNCEVHTECWTKLIERKKHAYLQQVDGNAKADGAVVREREGVPPRLGRRGGTREKISHGVQYR